LKKTSGFENIPKEGPAIIAMNHQSFFDFLSVAALAPRNIHFLAAEKFFENKYWKILMIATGQIRVDRKAEDKTKSLQGIQNHLKAGTLVGIFPEGTRSHLREEMLKAFTGIAKFSLENKVPIIPVGIVGTHEILSKGDKKMKIKKVLEIHVGRPMNFTKYHGRHNDKEICNFITERVMMEIAKLSGKKYPHCESQLHNKFVDKNVALIDLDGTLTRDQTQGLFIKHLRNSGFLNKIDLILIYIWFFLYKLGIISNPKKALGFILKKFIKKDMSIINNNVDEFYDDTCKENVYNQALDLCRKLKGEGYYTILTSSAVEPIVKKFASKLSFDDYICTELETENNMLTGKLKGEAHHGIKKVHALADYFQNHNINPQNIIAVSDHHSDIPLLQYADHPISTNPNRKLLKYSTKNNIPVLYLDNDELFQHIKSNIIN
jgi:1-acyl-sn-glycerol-3-phosphate acyltransferase